MIALWSNALGVLKYWLPSLRQLPNGSRPNPHLLAMVSKGSLAHADLTRIESAVSGLRAMGLKTMPACTTLKQDYGHTYESWFDRRLWSQMAETLAALAGLRDDDPRIAIDLEPYWSAARATRYPKRAEPGGDRGDDEYRLAETLAPLIGTIKHEGITPWLLPGGMEYAAVWHLATACPDAVLLDETTYSCPLDPAHWKHYHRRKPAIEALRRGYLPGFYAVALRSRAFQAELRRKGIGDYWVYFRAEDQMERFWTLGWASGTETQLPRD